MNLLSLYEDGRLRAIYGKFSLEREVASYLGISLGSLYKFFSKYPEVNRRSWLRRPSRLSLRWLKTQGSEEINQFFRDEYHTLGCKTFCEKYHPTSFAKITQYLGLRRGQAYYISPYANNPVHSMPNNPLLNESDFKYWFLGYFLGDGHLKPSSEGYEVSVFSTDQQVIDLMYSAFGISEPSKVPGYVRICTNRKVLPCYVFRTTDLAIRSILELYKFTSTKSKTGWYGWDLIPEEFRPAFLRGLYESDGSYVDTTRWRLSWFGHESYMKPIAEYLDLDTILHSGLFQVTLCNKFTRGYIRQMYPSIQGLGTTEYPANLRKAYKALRVLSEGKNE